MMQIIPEHKRERIHFESLTREEVSDAIRDMRAMGSSEYSIAAACRLSVESVRQILAEWREAQT